MITQNCGRGKEGEPLLFYRNPTANFRDYDKVIIDPVTIWRGEDSKLGKIPERDLRQLALLLRVKAIEAVRGDGMKIVGRTWNWRHAHQIGAHRS